MADEERYGVHQRLAERFGERAGEALYIFVAAMAIPVSGFAAFFTGQERTAWQQLARWLRKSRQGPDSLCSA
jgi:hypothetical protein